MHKILAFSVTWQQRPRDSRNLVGGLWRRTHCATGTQKLKRRAPWRSTQALPKVFFTFKMS